MSSVCAVLLTGYDATNKPSWKMKLHGSEVYV